MPRSILILARWGLSLVVAVLIDCGAYHVLWLQHRKRNEVWIGVPDTLDRTLLEDLLQGHGLECLSADDVPNQNADESTVRERIEAVLKEGTEDAVNEGAFGESIPRS